MDKYTKRFLLSVGNLQTFSDPNGGQDEGGNGESEVTPPAFNIEDVLSNPDFQKFFQSEQDKIRTEYSKKNTALQKQLEDEKKSKMTEQEKLEAAQRELEEKGKALQERENRLFAISALSEAEMPSSFLPFVVASSEEETNEKISSLKTEFDKAVSEKVQDTFRSTGRKLQKGAGDTGYTVEQFNKMDIHQRTQLFKEDPDLYSKLAKGE